MPTAVNLEQLGILARYTGTAPVKYAPELYALLVSVDAVDCPPGAGTSHAIYIGPPGESMCLFRGCLSITRRKILPKWKNAYEIALEATFQEVYGEKRNRETGMGDYVIMWLEK